MRILALVTARGGSKRLPGKNLRPLGGKPLVVWSIEAARGIPEILDILVSTDDAQIAEVSRNAGALVPWLRPSKLASDTATSVDACLHALDWYEGENGLVDGLLLLQPTSPFRRRETVLRGIKLFRVNRRQSVIAVSPAASHPMQCFHVAGQTMRPFIESRGLNLRSQDLPPAYVVNGALYLIAPDELRRMRSFIADESVPLVIDNPAEAIDIDTEWDWKMSEAALTLLAPIRND